VHHRRGGEAFRSRHRAPRSQAVGGLGQRGQPGWLLVSTPAAVGVRALLSRRAVVPAEATRKLRLDHPQASLEQLGAAADPPLTEDAVASRLRRLLSHADQYETSTRLPAPQAEGGPELLGTDEDRAQVCRSPHAQGGSSTSREGEGHSLVRPQGPG